MSEPLYFDADWRPTEAAPRFLREGSASAWRRYFAWHPVRLGNLQSHTPAWAWWRTVECRTFYCAFWMSGNFSMRQYREAIPEPLPGLTLAQSEHVRKGYPL